MGRSFVLSAGIIGGRRAKCEINAAKRASESESESIKFATAK